MGAGRGKGAAQRCQPPVDGALHPDSKLTKTPHTTLPLPLPLPLPQGQPVSKENYLAQIDAGGFKLPVMAGLSDAEGNALDTAAATAAATAGLSAMNPYGAPPGSAGPAGAAGPGPSGAPNPHAATYSAPPPPDSFAGGRHPAGHTEWGQGAAAQQQGEGARERGVRMGKGKCVCRVCVCVCVCVCGVCRTTKLAQTPECVVVVGGCRYQPNLDRTQCKRAGGG